MDVSSWSMVLAIAGVVGLIGGVLAHFRQRSQARGNTPMVHLVRRRRELMERLNELAGPSGTELARLEARRTGSSSISIEALEAAVARAERLAINQTPEANS